MFPLSLSLSLSFAIYLYRPSLLTDPLDCILCPIWVDVGNLLLDKIYKIIKVQNIKKNLTLKIKWRHEQEKKKKDFEFFSFSVNI